MASRHCYRGMQTIPDEHAALLAHIGKYITLTSDEQQLLLSSVKIKRLQRRQFLVQEGSFCKYESFVVKGCLRTYYTDPKGVDHTLSFAVEDWWAADLESFLHGTPAKWNIEALEPTVLLCIEKQDLDRLYQQIPAFERFFRLLHQQAFIAQTNRILWSISLPGAARYAAFLATYPAIAQRIAQKYIASYLGITPVFLSQLRKPGGKQ